MPHLNSIVRRVLQEAEDAPAVSVVSMPPAGEGLPPAQPPASPAEKTGAGTAEKPAAQGSPRAPKKVRLQDRERIYWSSVATTIGTYTATGLMPGEDTGKSTATAGVNEMFPYKLPGAIRLGEEIGNSEPKSVWWGERGSFTQLADDWKSWKASANVELKNMGITTKGKARLLTALSYIMPAVGVACAAAATALAGPIAGSVTTSVATALTGTISAQAKEARAKVAAMEKRAPEEIAPTVFQAAGDAAGAAVATKLAPKPI